ncbi:MAG: dehydrogenase E1 component subunit alpha/beta [Acidimicrobiia bacterium]|nr:dehydrogenase E1 component subunit alpha/beta [Acidimicrobiia bacterium]
MAIGIDPIHNHLSLGLNDDALLHMYRTMVLARRVDDRMWALNRQGRAPFVVSASGHEAAQVGTALALDRRHDWALPYYRDTAGALALGMTAEEVFLGVFSKAGDPNSGGRQMPNHWSHPGLRIFSHSSVIATQFPHATGIARELQRTGKPGVVMVWGGEGATSEGDFHEALNFAAVRRLPVVFVIENNLYAISVPAAQEVAGDLAARAAGYGMPAVSIDGNDILEVYGTASEAVARARAGEGPSFIEARTYRHYAHTSDDDDKLYRTAAEVEMWLRRDPIGILKQYLVENRLLDDALETLIDNEVGAEVSGAVERAEKAADPIDPLAFVYANPIIPIDAAHTPEPTPVGDEKNLITAINATLHEILAADDRAVVFGEDVADPKGGVFKATVGLSQTFGEDRSFNMPLAESQIIGTAVGIAAAGGRPLPEIQFADYIHPAFDQIVSEVARLHYRTAGGWSCPMVIRVPYGGGIHGALYHSQSIEAFYAHIPGLKVVVPSTPADAKGLLWSAFDDPDPVMFLEPKKLYRLVKGPVPAGIHRVPIGKAAIRRPGRDLTIIAYGTMAHFAVEAANQLSAEGIEAEVLDLRSLKPLDWPSIEAAVQRTSKVLIVYEDNEFGGFGAEVSAQITEKAFEWLDAPVRRYATPDVPTFPFSGALEDQVMPNVAGIVNRARELAQY